ncbi:parallel beta-helix domain-containing protein [Fulvivirgaceae bacterium BMA12]|uniref:Parallel beta-helix domain-containing protein n=1 Tax=Agaribacillus aureus TaxID=3051825 RepID=A0ABT8L2D7_9BACT|nr:parallel beta-helix domain-containing protein [Fulvivirgaceae bacterium BMA12]
MTYRHFFHSAVLLFTVLMIACTSPQKQEGTLENVKVFVPGQEKEIRAALIGIENNTEIILKEGVYNFDKISIQGPVNKVIFRGEDPQKTIVDFSGQSSGGEGLRVDDVTDFEIRDIQLRESNGDLLKVKDSKDVRFINVHTVWSGEPDVENGGYGIYPVLCENVLIDSCYVRGASDAGVYVGQTTKAVIKNSHAEYCVAGIEVENTIDAEVFNNEANNNTGGILVFDHPGLKNDGQNIRVYNNHVHDNNYRNFAPAANSATGVGNVPPGTGIMVLRTSNVQVYDNEIHNNNTMAVGVISYLVLDPGILKNNPDFNPIPYNITLRNNKITKSDDFPPTVEGHELAQTIVALHQNLLAAGALQPGQGIPHILYDGIALAAGENPNNLCIDESDEVTFIELDAANDYANIHFDKSRYACKTL